MLTPETENRIVKYLLNEATAEDLDALSDWILVEGNDRIFKEFVRTHCETTTAMNRPDIDKIKEALKRRMKKDKNVFHSRKVRSLMKYAAVGLIFLTLGYLYHGNQIKKVMGKLVPKEEAITITLDNGAVETLNPTMNRNIKDAQGNIIGNQDRSRLTYHAATTPSTEGTHNKNLEYNTIKVPYGKRFDLILADGTHVFLNSGTILRYPVQFLKGFDRNVFLSGEAYFDVAKDKEHPFIVHADEVDIEVLGTRFNVSHYPEDTNINTVLVEGSVELHTKGQEDGESGEATLLKPGFKAVWPKAGKDLAIEKVDTEIYTAWVQGQLVFRNTPFRKIRQALERKYNVTIKNRNKDLDEQLFDATFDIETIEEVLESFNKSYAIEYRIEDNEVIIE